MLDKLNQGKSTLLMNQTLDDFKVLMMNETLGWMRSNQDVFVFNNVMHDVSVLIKELSSHYYNDA